MMRKAKKLTTLLFLLSILFSTTIKSYSDNLFEHLDNKTEAAQQEVETLYQELFNQEYFPQDNKDESLVLKYKINSNPLQTGPVLINLIEWIQKNKPYDPIGQIFIKKINRYLYLTFRELISNFIAEKKCNAHLLGLLHKFYKFNIPTENQSEESLKKVTYPFQPILSKTVIFIFTVNSTNLAYPKKVEHITYFLDKIRREIHEVKKNILECSLTDEEFDEFIEMLQTFAAKEPIIRPNYPKILLITLTVIVVIVIVVYALIHFVISPIVRKISRNLLESLPNACENLINRLHELPADHPAVRILIPILQLAIHFLPQQTTSTPTNASPTRSWSWYNPWTWKT